MNYYYYELLKNLPDHAKQALLDTFNNIWTCGVYPEKWKESIIIPVLKEGKDPALAASYRPISLISCLGKLLEKIVAR